MALGMGLDSVVSSVCTGHVRDCFYGVRTLQPAVPLWMPPLSLFPPQNFLQLTNTIYVCIFNSASLSRMEVSRDGVIAAFGHYPTSTCSDNTSQQLPRLCLYMEQVRHATEKVQLRQFPCPDRSNTLDILVGSIIINNIILQMNKAKMNNLEEKRGHGFLWLVRSIPVRYKRVGV